MSFKNQVIVIILLYLLSLAYIRGFLYGVKRYQLNNNAYKKRKKGETFKEWLFYSRYKEEIPRILRVLYYVILISHPVSVIACAFSYIAKLPSNPGESLPFFIIIFDFIWMTTIALLFGSLTKPDFVFERWIPKKRGQKPKKK